MQDLLAALDDLFRTQEERDQGTDGTTEKLVERCKIAELPGWSRELPRRNWPEEHLCSIEQQLELRVRELLAISAKARRKQRTI